MTAAWVRYEGEFELAWLRDGERVMSAGDGTGAAIVVSPDGSECRVNIGDEIKVRGTGAREAEGSGLLSRPAGNSRAGSNPAPSVGFGDCARDEAGVALGGAKQASSGARDRPGAAQGGTA